MKRAPPPKSLLMASEGHFCYATLAFFQEWLGGSCSPPRDLPPVPMVNRLLSIGKGEKKTPSGLKKVKGNKKTHVN